MSALRCCSSELAIRIQTRKDDWKIMIFKDITFENIYNYHWCITIGSKDWLVLIVSKYLSGKMPINRHLLIVFMALDCANTFLIVPSIILPILESPNLCKLIFPLWLYPYLMVFTSFSLSQISQAVVPVKSTCFWIFESLYAMLIPITSDISLIPWREIGVGKTLPRT